MCSNIYIYIFFYIRIGNTYANEIIEEEKVSPDYKIK